MQDNGNWDSGGGGDTNRIRHVDDSGGDASGSSVNSSNIRNMNGSTNSRASHQQQLQQPSDPIVIEDHSQNTVSYHPVQSSISPTNSPTSLPQHHLHQYTHRARPHYGLATFIALFISLTLTIQHAIVMDYLPPDTTSKYFTVKLADPGHLLFLIGIPFGCAALAALTVRVFWWPRRRKAYAKRVANLAAAAAAENLEALRMVKKETKQHSPPHPHHHHVMVASNQALDRFPQFNGSQAVGKGLGILEQHQPHHQDEQHKQEHYLDDDGAHHEDSDPEGLHMRQLRDSTMTVVEQPQERILQGHADAKFVGTPQSGLSSNKSSQRDLPQLQVPSRAQNPIQSPRSPAILPMSPSQNPFNLLKVRFRTPTMSPNHSPVMPRSNLFKEPVSILNTASPTATQPSLPQQRSNSEMEYVAAVRAMEQAVRHKDSLRKISNRVTSDDEEEEDEEDIEKEFEEEEDEEEEEEDMAFSSDDDENVESRLDAEERIERPPAGVRGSIKFLASNRNPLIASSQDVIERAAIKAAQEASPLWHRQHLTRAEADKAWRRLWQLSLVTCIGTIVLATTNVVGSVVIIDSAGIRLADVEEGLVRALVAFMLAFIAFAYLCGDIYAFFKASLALQIIRQNEGDLDPKARVHKGPPLDLLQTEDKILAFSTCALMAIVNMSSIIFSRIEGWSFRDAEQWYVASIGCIGFALRRTETKLGKGLLLIFNTLGIVMIGILLTSSSNKMIAVLRSWLIRGIQRARNKAAERKRRRQERRVKRALEMESVQNIPRFSSLSFTSLSRFGRASKSAAASPEREDLPIDDGHLSPRTSVSQLPFRRNLSESALPALKAPFSSSPPRSQQSYINLTTLSQHHHNSPDKRQEEFQPTQHNPSELQYSGPSQSSFLVSNNRSQLPLQINRRLSNGNLTGISNGSRADSSCDEGSRRRPNPASMRFAGIIEGDLPLTRTETIDSTYEAALELGYADDLPASPPPLKKKFKLFGGAASSALRPHRHTVNRGESSLARSPITNPEPGGQRFEIEDDSGHEPTTTLDIKAAEELLREFQEARKVVVAAATRSPELRYQQDAGSLNEIEMQRQGSGVGILTRLTSWFHQSQPSMTPHLLPRLHQSPPINDGSLVGITVETPQPTSSEHLMDRGSSTAHSPEIRGSLQHQHLDDRSSHHDPALHHKPKVKGVRRWFRSVQDQAEAHADGLVAVSAVLCTLFGGSLVLSLSENWDYLDSIYFTYSLLTTTGYGDLYPASAWGRTWVMALTFIGLGVWAYALATIIARLQALRIGQQASRIRAFRKLLRKRADKENKKKKAAEAAAAQRSGTSMTNPSPARSIADDDGNNNNRNDSIDTTPTAKDFLTTADVNVDSLRNRFPSLNGQRGMSINSNHTQRSSQNVGGMPGNGGAASALRSLWSST